MPSLTDPAGESSAGVSAPGGAPCEGAIPPAMRAAPRYPRAPQPSLTSLIARLAFRALRRHLRQLRDDYKSAVFGLKKLRRRPFLSRSRNVSASGLSGEASNIRRRLLISLWPAWRRAALRSGSIEASAPARGRVRQETGETERISKGGWRRRSPLERLTRLLSSG